MGQTSRTVIAVLVLCVFALAHSGVEARVFPEIYLGPCLEQCCCRVCGSPSAPAYPYGLPTFANELNVWNPTVVGAACHVPVWRDQGLVNSSSGYILPPPTLFWTQPSVFDDNAAHVSPINCSCCQISVDTSCAETPPIATVPKNFRVVNGYATEGQPLTLEFMSGVQLSTFDMVELRNNTFCGYRSPGWLARSTPAQLTVSADETRLNWTLPFAPNHRCLRVCYYHRNLTSPGWYNLGDVTIQQSQSSISYFMDSRDVLLTGNTVVMTFIGSNTFSVFSDSAEIRPSAGTCGSGSPTQATGAVYGTLQVASNETDWCHPMPAAKYTTYRPTQLIPPTYSDCPTNNRVLQDRLVWTMTLPAAGTYKVCLRTTVSGTVSWRTMPTFLTVVAQNTAKVALTALYNNLGGASWKYKNNWITASDECTWYGVRCSSTKSVTGVFLGRNNLVGTLPNAFFYSAFYNTIIDLKLDMNSITGPIPPAIGAFRNLKMLNLALNQLTGVVPFTLLRTQLQSLYISGNAGLDGNIPYNLTQLSQQWHAQTALTEASADVLPSTCPVGDMVCSDKGSTDTGVTQCGHSGITEEACTVQGCCWNQQASLSFGGSSCFTKRDRRAANFPQCEDTTCYMVQVDE